MIREIPWVIEEQTKVKHQLLEGYLGGWMAIMFSQQETLSHILPKLIYVDGFSGPGEYWGEDAKTTKVQGSPLIVAAKANKYLDENPKRTLSIICIDSEEKCATHLEPLLNGVNRHKQNWRTVHGTFEEGIKAIFDYLDSVKKNIAPAFFFIDPFGYSGFSMETLKRILAHQRTELFINFMYYDINRFVSAEHATPHLQSMFGSDEFQEAISFSDEKRMNFLMTLYCKKLKEIAGAQYVLPFRVNTPGQGTRPRYFLIHASQHIKALRVMKDAMARISTQAFRFEAIGVDRDRQLDLFEPSDEQKLSAEIYSYLWTIPTAEISYENLEDWAYETTAGVAKDIKKALCSLETDKGLVINRRPRQRRNTVNKGASICKPSVAVEATP